MVFAERKKKHNVLVRAGRIEFYMNGEFNRARRYQSVKGRKIIIEGWLNGIRNIRDVNRFYYVIVPDG